MSDPHESHGDATGETGFGDWPTGRLRDQVKHLGSIVTISAGQADHALLREELNAMNAELAKREGSGEIR